MRPSWESEAKAHPPGWVRSGLLNKLLKVHEPLIIPYQIKPYFLGMGGIRAANSLMGFHNRISKIWHFTIEYLHKFVFLKQRQATFEIRFGNPSPF